MFSIDFRFSNYFLSVGAELDNVKGQLYLVQCYKELE